MRKSRIIPHRGTMSPADWCCRRAALPLLFALSFLLFPLFPAAVNAQFSGAEAGKAREVIAAVPRKFPPLVDVDDAGEPVGLAIDMLNEIARRAGLRVEYLVLNDWRSAARAVADGRADLLPGAGRTAAGEKTMIFTRPFDTLAISLFVRSGANGINGLLDLSGRRVAVVGGNAGAAVLRPYRSISAETFASFEDALVALLAGHVDALIYPAPVVWHTARKIGVADRIRMVGRPLAEIKRSIAVRRQDVALLRRLDTAMAAFLGTPEATAIYLKWREPQRPFFRRAVVWWTLSGVLLLLLIGVAAWRIVSVFRLNRELTAAAAARERAETAQRASDERLNIAFETGGVGMTVTDADGKLVRVNKAFCALLGYTEAEILGRTVIDLVHPDDAEESRKRRARLLAGEVDRLQIDRRYVRKDGGVVWTLSGLSAARGEDGGIAYFIGNVQDITGRKLAEQALRESEERSRLLLDSTGEAIYGIDNEGLCTFANPMCAELLGYASPDELLGKHMHDLIHHTRADGDPYPVNECRIYRAFIEGKGSHVNDEVLWRSDGGSFPAEYRSFPLRHDGDIVGAVVSFVDISAQKRAEERLRDSEERFRTAFEVGGVGMYVVDGDGRLIDVNESFARFLGVSRAELRGSKVLAYVHPEEIEAARDNLRDIASGKTPRVTFERRYMHRDGSVLTGIANASAVGGADGKVKYIIANVQDITDRKRAEESRNDSEQRIRSIMENIADGLVTMDSDRVIETVNPAVTRMFGYTAQELIGEPVSILMPEPYRSAHDSYVGAYLETGEGKILGVGPREVSGLRKDGSEFPMSLAVSEMQLGEKRIFIGALRDITEQKRAEADLLRKTEYLDLVRKTAVAANQASDFEAAVEACLKDVCTSLGLLAGHAYVPAEDGDARMLPTTIWHLDDPDRFEPYRRVTEDTVFAKGEGLPGRILKSARPEWVSDYRRHKNSPRLAAAAEVGLRSAFGVPVLAGSEVIAVLEFFSEQVTRRDEALLDVLLQVGTQLGRVAERARAAEALHADEERLRQIIDLVPHRIFIKDWNGVYLLANKAVADAHGVSVGELEGKTHGEVHPDDPEDAKFLRDDREVIDGGEPKLIPEETYVDYNGNSQILRTIKVPFTTTAGGRPAVLGVSVDITDLKMAEDQLRHVQKLEAIGQLTGGLAHDFNNLLTIMLGNLQLLLRRLDDDKLREMVFTAERAGRRGAELTQRLLAFGRRQSLEPRVVDLNRLVLGMSELLRRTLGETIEIETVVADAIKQTLVDPAQVENAILNLAINARDAMPHGGVLTIRTGARKVGRQTAVGGDDVSPGEYVMLAISDTGTGMPPDVAARAFDPFFTTKEVGRGSGLGLSMIYGFCRQSGGFATIDSEPGQGTTVSLFLPAADGAQMDDAASSDAAVETADTAFAAATDETGHETVLVVEDDPGVRLFAATVLSSLNYNVIEAADGPAALETLESNGKIDVLFTDVVLPGGVDGRDIADQARTRQPEINVLFTSGFAVDELDHENRESMELSMLRKPYTGAELAAKIRGVIENLNGGIQ